MGFLSNLETRALKVEGFDEKKLRKFMDLGSKLAGTSASQLDTFLPKQEVRITRSRADNRGLVSLGKGTDQLDDILSIFKRRTESIGARRSQPGQSQTRLV